MLRHCRRLRQHLTRQYEPKETAVLLLVFDKRYVSMSAASSSPLADDILTVFYQSARLPAFGIRASRRSIPAVSWQTLSSPFHVA